MVIGIVLIIVVVLLLCFVGTTKQLPIITSKGGKNNPGFLIHTNTTWKGKEDSTGCKFENFATLRYGVRAWYVNLFGKVQNGTITNTNQMIDILTPAGNENSEIARNNYKSSVARATNWLELGTAVFNFEANPDWLNSSEKQQALENGFSDAVQYRYAGNIPQYFK